MMWLPEGSESFFTIGLTNFNTARYRRVIVLSGVVMGVAWVKAVINWAR